ncbi:MAG: hypothetical protein ACRDUY_08240 [Nitriliruptorales bacterium]
MSGAVASRLTVAKDVIRERRRQDALWGEQNHPDGTGVRAGRTPLATWAREETDRAAARGDLTWRHILFEEAAEAFDEGNPQALREELIQVAAVAHAWVEAIDRRPA